MKLVELWAGPLDGLMVEVADLPAAELLVESPHQAVLKSDHPSRFGKKLLHAYDYEFTDVRIEPNVTRFRFREDVWV